MRSSPIDEIVQSCLAVRVRLIGRTVTNLYDEALERHDVTVAQVNLLAALGKVGPCAPSHLGEVLQLERSTVSRNLRSLMKRGWIEAAASDGKGIREIVLTRSGHAKIESVMPEWREAQRRAAEVLGAGVEAVQAIAAGLGYPPGTR